MKNNIVLITGSNGLIGSELGSVLAAQDFKVYGLPHEELTDPNLSKTIADINPSYLFHLAAYANHSNQTDDDMTIASNIVGTYLLLKATKDLDYTAFINVSSSSVYGTKREPMSELMTLDTDTMYGASKVSGEYLARAFAKQYNKPICSVRPFSAYLTIYMVCLPCFMSPLWYVI